jgi:hypothetical protein
MSYETPGLGVQPTPSGSPPVIDVSTASTNGTDGQSAPAQVAGTAADAGKHVAGTTKEQASQVAGEAAQQARNLLGQTQQELKQQAAAQQQRVADGVRTLSQQLASMADGAEQPGTATDVVREVSDRSRQVADWLENRDAGGILDDVRTFARRRPGAFLAIAAGAGLLAGRLTRGAVDQARDHGQATSDGASSGPAYPSYPAYPPVPAPLPTATGPEPYPGPAPAPTQTPAAGTAPQWTSPGTPGYEPPVLP